jgi:g-D-glutamyl-meso-diaminopimelate peptidase
MQPNYTKRIVAVVIVVVLIGLGFFAFLSPNKTAVNPSPTTTPSNIQPTHTVIGQSVQGRNIEAFSYGNGSTTLLFVGGIHGGYEWNSVLLAYTFMDYLEANPTFIPTNLTITVIPSANPDAVFAVTGKEGRFTSADVSTDVKVLESARFNADKVDLNRNFDCKWQAKSTWQSKTVSAGKTVFSEPEARAIRDYVKEIQPTAAIFWHSQSNAVYASQCLKGILPSTLALMNTYSKAAGYPAVKTFDAYATTGAADDWLASQNIPAITVELSTHNTIEWDKNLKGVKAVVEEFSR